MNAFYRFITAIAIILAVSACGGGGGGGDSQDDNGANPGGARTTATGATFLTGSDITVSTSTIDDNGGTITITGTGTHLDGTQVSVPAGALPDAREVAVGYNDGTVQLPVGTTSSSVPRTLIIRVSGSSTFLRPVSITIPYGSGQGLPTPFYIDPNGRLRPVLVTDTNHTNRTVTFVTLHPALWTWVSDTATTTAATDTGFRPADDGFQIVNYGSSIHNGGECFGMSAFAQWYYDAQMPSNGDFYDKYMDSVGSDRSGNTLTGQDVIATRAHSAINQAWTFSNDIIPNTGTRAEDRYNAIVSALKLTRRPVTLFLLPANSNSGHAVLSFGVDEDKGRLSIYDPNHPGEIREIVYDKSAQTFQPYSGYSRVFLNGSGTYSLDESFANIFADAQHSFTADNMPHISITSHQNGETVDTRNITLTGVVESSEVLVRKIDVLVGNEKFSTSVATDGAFSLGLSLNPGEQRLRFIVRDEADHPLTPNNTDTAPFAINVASNTSVMLVTLTWDEGDTDVDLYVIDPQGDYSVYYHMLTDDGGELDYDVTTGYGPEHWTLAPDDTVRWDQASYRVRVHYYSGPAGGTHYKLTVKLYEGTEREVEYVNTGYLAVSNPDNDQPDATGPDWAEFTLPITLTAASTAAPRALRAPPAPVPAAIPAPGVRRALKNR